MSCILGILQRNRSDDMSLLSVVMEEFVPFISHSLILFVGGVSKIRLLNSSP